MKKIAYLTIDDSPSEHFSQKMEYLAEKSIPAVWFCEGRRIAQYPQAVQTAIRKGFIIANHSYNHPHFSTITLDEAEAEILSTHHLIAQQYQAVGIQQPALFFRFPYLDKGALTGSNFTEKLSPEGQARKAHIQKFLRALGYSQPAFEGVTYQWCQTYGLLDDVDWMCSYDCMEWSLIVDNPMHGIDSIEKVFARMDEDVPEGGRGLNYADSEEVLLIHDHAGTTGHFVPIVERLLEKGIQFAEIPLA